MQNARTGFAQRRKLGLLRGASYREGVSPGTEQDEQFPLRFAQIAANTTEGCDSAGMAVDQSGLGFNRHIGAIFHPELVGEIEIRRCGHE